MIFAVNVINHTLPQVSVVNADSGVPPITYSQIKNSLGNHIYNVENFYLWSDQLNQLIGTIQYNRYDATGDKFYTTIATTVDPYQPANAINADLTKYENMFILNGNSSVSTTILPNASLQVTLYSKRITNSFGANINSFKEMEDIFRKPDFFKEYGDIEAIQETNRKVEKTASFSGEPYKDGDGVPIAILSILVVFLGIFYLKKEKHI